MIAAAGPIVSWRYPPANDVTSVILPPKMRIRGTAVIYAVVANAYMHAERSVLPVIVPLGMVS